MVSKKTRKILFGTALGVTLATGVSLYPLMNYLVKNNTQDFDKVSFVIKGDTLTKQSFYDRLTYRNQAWYVSTSEGLLVNVDSLIDFKIKDAQNYAALKNVKPTKSVDTVYVRFAHGTKHYRMSDIVYGMGTQDSLGYLPSFGSHSYGKIKLRYFKADSEALQKVVDVYNDNYNCTYRHEFQHYLNLIAGIQRGGQSYENKFVECCLDEISANIAQLKEQRKHYLENGGDLSYITSRFKFYKEGIERGIINPKNENLSDKEKEFIANGVFDTWMKDKFNIYVKSNASRTIWSLVKTNYNGVQPNEERHKNLVQRMLNIDGIDFAPYVLQRENEIKERIPEKTLKNFRAWKKKKYQEMTYLDQLEKLKIEKGTKEYKKEMIKNKFFASLKKIVDR